MKKGMCAVSVFCLLFAVILLTLTGCGAGNGDAQEPKNQEKASFTLSRDDTLPVTESTYGIKLKDSDCGNLIALDANYYYLENEDKAQKTYLRAARKGGNAEEIASLGKKWKDWTETLRHGYKGDIYVGLWKGTGEHDETFTGDYDKLSSPGIYRILKLSQGKPEQEIFHCKTMGFPQITSAGNRVALEINSGKSLRFVAIDLDTGKETEIFHSDFERGEDGNFSGTILMGMEYSKAAASASDEGICYQTCTFENESMFSAETGDNQFVYYDFRSGKNIKLGNHYRPVEYIGGTEKMYLTCDYPSDVSAAPVTFYLKDAENGTWQAYNFEQDKTKDKEALEPFHFGWGSGLLDVDTLAAYHDGGFFIIDAKTKTYLAKTYSTDQETLNEQDLEKLDYKEEVTGAACGDSTFAFSVMQGTELVIHEITKK